MDHYGSIIREKETPMSMRFQGDLSPPRGVLSQLTKQTVELGKSEETRDFFEKKFSADLNEIQDKLKLLNDTFESRPHYFELEDMNALGMFSSLSDDIKNLQNYLTKSTKFLPDYKIKNSQAKITELSKNYDTTRNRILPKKKFGFKGRKKDASTSKKLKENKKEDNQVDKEVSKKEEKQESKKEKKEKETKESKEKKKEKETKDQKQDEKDNKNDIIWPEKSRRDYLKRSSLNINTIEKIENQYIKYAGHELDNFDINLLDLKNCFIDLQGHITSLRISNIIDCVILAGPVKFSIYAEKCHNSTFALSCQQFRLHDSTACRIYLHVSTRAIMESCSRMSFSEYNYDYPEIERDFESFNVDKNNNNYKKIIDFNWLSPTQSPNWKIIQPDAIDDWDKLRKEFQAKKQEREKARE